MHEGLGAAPLGEGRSRFRVWAPEAALVEVVLPGQDRVQPLEPAPRGYHSAVVNGVEPGARYLFRLNGEGGLPDPASRSQPEGVHEPSELIDPGSFEWTDDAWRGLPLDEMVLYELHVGTFSPEGTFDAVVSYLDDLAEMGVTAVEIMPVGQFPGSRNWGYDGVYPYAAQASYGGPVGLARLVDQCHRRGLAAVLDVVYNHLGPEGNYLAEFGPYFTDRYRTPWGPAINFDGPGSDEVRRYFIGNALAWFEDFHFDGLRIDAIQGIVDTSPRPFLQELAEAKESLEDRTGRRKYLIAESDLNDPRIVGRRELGGYGLDGQWNDDFHHALHALLTGENTGYYADFGSVRHLAKAIGEGYVYSGQYSTFRGRRHGTSSRDIPARRFVVFAQNHDQIGNRIRGERLSALVSFEALKLAAGTVLLAPGLPLLFMGEEYGETAPFQYFVSHADPALVESVRTGRAGEFASFRWAGEDPDPQDEDTFMRSKLDHSLKEKDQHRILLDLHRELLRLRREHPSLALLSRDHLEVASDDREGVMMVRRFAEDEEALAVYNFGSGPAAVPMPMGQEWILLLDSSSGRWGGPGDLAAAAIDPSGDEASVPIWPKSFALFARHGDQGMGS